MLQGSPAKKALGVRKRDIEERAWYDVMLVPSLCWFLLYVGSFAMLVLSLCWRRGAERIVECDEDGVVAKDGVIAEDGMRYAWFGTV